MRKTGTKWLGNRGTLRKLGLAVLTLATAFSLPLAARAVTPTVTLTPSVSSPQMLGTAITWTAAVMNPVASDTYSYQFNVTFNGVTQLVSDFSPTPTFTWTPYLVEGAYAFSVTVRDTTTPTIFAPVSVPYTLQPWVTTPGAAGIVNPSANSLVAYFSAPPCTVGQSVLVRFQPAAPTGTQSPSSMTTNLVPCSANSANFYVAGMYPTSTYSMHWETYSGSTLVNTGGNLSFTTGALPSTFPSTNTYTPTVPATSIDATYPVVLLQTAYPNAVDLNGNVIWYFPHNTGLTVSEFALSRMEPNGLFYSTPSGLLIQQYNLAGNVVMQTNLEIVNEQLAAKGYPTLLQLDGHEVRNLPDGNIAFLGLRNVSSTTAQGGTPTKPVIIQGSMAIVVNRNLQVVWAWDSFAHQDVTRFATDGDLTSGGDQDWTHANALQETNDGNIIISERAQDWVLKIAYENGTGDGHVIWHLGTGGDFELANPPAGSCLDPTSDNASSPGGDNLIPWFTHQHDSHFDFENDASGNGFMILTVFDDGNTRHDKCTGTQNSRGMVLLLDEATMQAYIATQADLGNYSTAVGSAQLLTNPNGNLYSSFDSGIIQPGSFTQVSEVNLAGQIVYQMQTNQFTYRAYRMANLYTPTEWETTPPAGVENTQPATLPFNYNSGFAQNQEELAFGGSASLAGNVLELTNGTPNVANSVYYNSPVNIQTFTTDFTFQLTSPKADGFTFTIQNAGPNAVGGLGGGLGYKDIGESVAIKFDLYSNSGEGPDSTGLYTDGANPAQPSVNLTGSGIDLHSGDLMDAHITYDGTTLILTITDMVTAATYSHPFTINIPATVGGSTAYVGFTAGSGALTAVQQILSWSYEPTMVPYKPGGFPTGTTSLTLNGSATVAGSDIVLTNGGANQAGSAFYTVPVNVQSFTTDFDFQLTEAKADGFTFTIQGDGPTALNGYGASLGYLGMAKSVAVKFDLYNNAGEGSDSTGLYLNGASPTLPSIDLTSSGVNLHSGDMMHATLNYDGNALTLTITDLVTKATFTQPFAVDIPLNVGGTTAYVGFTAGTGGASATQQILNWTFE